MPPSGRTASAPAVRLVALEGLVTGRAAGHRVWTWGAAAHIPWAMQRLAAVAPADWETLAQQEASG